MPIDPEQIERVYSNYAGVYDRVFGKVFQASREAVVRNLKIDPGERVLEVGVGTGLCLPMYPTLCDVTAIDVSEPMLQKAAERVREHDLTNVKLHKMDAGNMTFADNSFDLIIAAYVVTAVPDYRKLMSEMVRVSRPGGRLVLLNHFTQDSPIIAAVEKAISPICIKMGFRTDLSVDEVIDGWPLIKERDERVKPLGMWHVVECLNNKPSVSREIEAVSGDGSA
jgi:phosphatidylethanolamine/phosphatidyl-N-methylethanolamine N-methyltransferase